MAHSSDIFLFVTGAGSCVRVPELIDGLVARRYNVYSVLTPNVAMVTAPAPLMAIEGNYWLHSYRQAPLDRFPFGTMLVAPCTFNSFNKIALGLADNLAMSMIADGLGAGCPLLIAPSMNQGLWAHPQTQTSLARLQSWGCEIIQPQIMGRRVTMAATEDILAHF